MKAMLPLILFAAFFLSCGGSADSKPVAIVNGDPITVKQLASVLPMNLDTTAQGDSVRARSLDNLIIKRLFVQEARRLGLDSGLSYQIETLQKGEVTQKLYDTITAPANKVSDADLKRARELLVTEAHVQMIAVRSESAASRILTELEQGVPFETLAVRNSTHASSVRGGDVGFIPELYLEEPLRSAVLVLKPGEHTKPVKTDQTWQILKLVETRPASPAPPALTEPDFRAQLEGRLKQQTRRELANEYLATMRARLEYNEPGVQLLMTKPVDSMTEADKDVAVATKDKKQYVKVSRLLKVAATFTPGLDTAMKRYAIQREIEDDLLYEDGLARGLDKAPDVREKTDRAREDQLYRALFQQEITNKVNVTDADILAYHQQNQDKFVEKDIAKATPYIRNVLQQQGREAAYKSYVEGLRAKAKITIDEKLLKTVKHPVDKSKPAAVKAVKPAKTPTTK